MSKTQKAMILPAPRADGTFETNYGSDIRIPDVPFSFNRSSNIDRYDGELDHWTAPRNLDGYHAYREYPDGYRTSAKCRHLFDVITSTKSHVHYDEDEAEIVDTEFRQVLTCTRCAYVIRQTGTLDEKSGKTEQLEPAPITAGELTAQQTAVQRYRETWSVHTSHGTKIGDLTWRMTTRGREYYTGSLTDRNTTVEGPTAAAALRKLAKFYTGTTA